MSRPWETIASPTRPWERGAGQNRVITISREVVTTTAGLQPTQEFNGAQRAALAIGVPCSIEVDRERGKPMGDVPGDIQSRTTWKVFIQPGDALAAGIASSGAVQTRDVLTDENGLTFQIAQSFWHALSGWQLRAELLQA